MSSFEGLEVEVVVSGGVATVSVRGELDPLSASHLDAATAEMWRPEVRKVALDLSGITFIDARGFDTLLRLSRYTRQTGRDLVVCRRSETVARVARLLQVDQSLLPLEPAGRTAATP